MVYHSPNILVSDFDGTLTQIDFFQAVLNEIVRDNLSIWHDYTSGQITHFEALAGYYRLIDWDEKRLLQLVDRCGFPDNFGKLVDKLNKNGWGVVIASAGCEWYIHRHLQRTGTLDRVHVHANHGSFVEGKGLLMELPRSSTFFDPKIGISKEGVVSHWLNKGKQVAFAGDGPTDLKPALIVPPERRFARGTLASILNSMNETYHPFDSWEEIPNQLLNQS